MPHIEILSELVWDNDTRKLEDLLKKIKNNDPDIRFLNNLDEWDVKGNSPLHLALMLGRKEAVKMLLEAGCSCYSINANGSDAFDEAASLGDRDILSAVFCKSLKEDSDSFMSPGGPWDMLSKAIPQGYIEIDIKLKSPVPIIAKFCPKDSIKIWKTKRSVRIDWSIRKIIGVKILRGSMSFIAKIQPKGTVSAVIINHEDKTFETLLPYPSAGIIHDFIDSILLFGVVRDLLPLDQYHWKRVQGNFGSKGKTRHIKKGNFKTEVYELGNLSCEQSVSCPVYESPNTYEDCRDACRTTQSVGEYIRGQKSLLEGQNYKIDTLETLQFISESDLTEEPDLEEAVKVFKSGTENISEEEVTFVDKTFKQKLGKLAKHVRRGSIASISGLISPNQLKERTDNLESTVSQRHIKSRSPPIKIEYYSKERYFTKLDGKAESSSIGRERLESSCEYSRSKPIYFYITNDLPFGFKDLLPFFEWILKKYIPEGILSNFVETNDIKGFPVRVEIPIMSLLRLKITLRKFEPQMKVKDDFFDVPENFKASDILPLVVE